MANEGNEEACVQHFLPLSILSCRNQQRKPLKAIHCRINAYSTNKSWLAVNRRIDLWMVGSVDSWCCESFAVCVCVWMVACVDVWFYKRFAVYMGSLMYGWLSVWMVGCMDVWLFCVMKGLLCM